MRIKCIVVLCVAIALTYSLNRRFDAGSFPIPPLAKLLDPFGGCWQNAETLSPPLTLNAALDGLYAQVRVTFDERMVPHIFAKNEHDLFFMQGYITATMRLWQMEFLTHVAAGRVAEIVGPRALPLDRTNRRLGLLHSARIAHRQIEKDSLTYAVLQAYTHGVNAYIRSLGYKNFPLEYKLLGYAPEPWTTLKPILLLKYMSNMLSANDDDVPHSNALALFGKENFEKLYPVFLDSMAPIIPAGTPWNFMPVAIKSPAEDTMQHAELIRGKGYGTEEADVMKGSNNWAVSGKKTASGHPILCNDPHLKLQLPSIWFEVQLSAPGINVYGVSIPGSPCAIIGFNDSIAWGSTNGSNDVRDWYKIKFKDEKRDVYYFDGAWRKTTKVTEEIKVCGQPSFVDTVVYTHHGPVVYDHTFAPGKRSNFANLAMKWTAQESSNELLTFYELAKGKNYADFSEALTHYRCPSQNFAFISAEGDIAIQHQGLMPARWKNQGRTVMNGSSSQYEWQGFVPQEHAPKIVNPASGFVQSANQHLADTTYPYFYDGFFEAYRSRRIYHLLDSMNRITPEDMKRMQYDNYNLRAAESLPLMLGYLDTTKLSPAEKGIVHTLKTWNYVNDPVYTAPTCYDVWWQSFFYAVWDEMISDSTVDLPLPYRYTTIRLMKTEPENIFFDRKDTPQKETLKSLLNDAFHAAMNDSLQGKNQAWGTYKSTTIEHLAQLPALSLKNVLTGGGADIINATRSASGASWRMVVEMGKEGVKAWGVYPGGQSGNAGSSYYTNFVDTWAKGAYYPLRFLKEADAPDKQFTTVLFQPAPK